MGARTHHRFVPHRFLRLRSERAGRFDRKTGAGGVEGAQRANQNGEVGMKRTPLFAVHQKLGARLIEFGGWEMPVFYSSIAGEHQATRNAAGLFDISHMGEFLVSGPAAAAFLNLVLT